MKWAGLVARMEETSGVKRVLVGKTLGRPRHRWEDNINLIFRKCDVVLWPRIGTVSGHL